MCDFKPETADRATDIRSAIEQQLEAEAMAADRSEEADGASMFMDSPVPEPVLHSTAAK
jgi:hypothetical protein